MYIGTSNITIIALVRNNFLILIWITIAIVIFSICLLLEIYAINKFYQSNILIKGLLFSSIGLIPLFFELHNMDG